MITNDILYICATITTKGVSLSRRRENEREFVQLNTQLLLPAFGNKRLDIFLNREDAFCAKFLNVP